MFTSFPPHCSPKEVSDIVAVLRKGWLAPGDNASALEKETAVKCGKKSGVLLNSKSSAIFIACFASGIHQDVEVLVPAIIDASVYAILKQLGAKINYYDVNLDTFTLEPEELAKHLTKNTTHIFVSNPLGLKYDYSSCFPNNYIIIEDLLFSCVENPTTTISILTFDGVCSVAVFSDNNIADRALCTRDWGRVGTQDEDVSKRYDGWVLDGVKYDYKFVYDHLGFNFKSCEMSATIALDRLRQLGDTVDDFNNLKNYEKIKLAQNGYSFIVKCQHENQDELVARLLGMQVTAHTMTSANLAFLTANDNNGNEVNGDDFPNAKNLFNNYMIINHSRDRYKNKVVTAAVLDVVEGKKEEEEDD